MNPWEESKKKTAQEANNLDLNEDKLDTRPYNYNRKY